MMISEAAHLGEIRNALSQGDVEQNIRQLPDDSLFLLAEYLTELRSLKPYPGWYFGIAEVSMSSVTQLRYLIWSICNARQLQKSICHPWYNNSKINLYLGNDVSRPMYIGGCIEPNEFAFINSILKEGMVMIDVGANDGLFTIFGASQVGQNGHILAFEPSTREVSRLQANVQINHHLKNITIIAKAASNKMGLAQLKISEYGHEGQNTLGNFAWAVQQAGVETVETCCLDLLPEVRALHRLDFMKIDVEGAELKVLQGAQEIIRKFKPVILLELLDRSLQYQESSASQVVQCLKSLGYLIYDFSPVSGKPLLSDLNNHSDNIIASIQHLPLNAGETI